MTTKIYALACCLFLASAALTAQTAKLNKAHKHFQDLDYQNAIRLYEEILQKSSPPQAIFNLAESYKHVGDTRKTEEWYAKSVLLPEATPEMFVYLAQAQLCNGNILAAKRNLEEFIAKRPGDKRGKNLLLACVDSVRAEMENGGAFYKVSNVEAINTPLDEFSPSLFKRGFVYCTERDTGGAVQRRTAWTGRPFVHQSYVIVRLVDEDKMEFKFGRSEPFGDDLATKWHDGPVCFTDDQTMIYGTRSHVQGKKVTRSSKGHVNLKIITARRAGEGWTGIDNVSFNNPEYSVMHPALSPDGKRLFFSSDMTDGFGGMDLYVAYFENGAWSAPVNLGPGINTEADEAFPFVGKDGVLYFASDGHTGMGGMDIYYSRAVRGVWEPVTNMGAPINSGRDDFGFVMDTTRKFGFISSNRDGGKGLTDIYLFTRLTVDAELLVFRDDNGQGLDSVTVTSDCFPRKTYYTNPDGKLYIELPVDKTCKFTFSSPNFETKEVDISTKDYAIGSQLVQQVPIPSKKNLVFAVEGSVHDKDENKTIAGAQIVLQSSCSNNSITSTVDDNGAFFLPLEANCCYVVRASKSGYFTATTNFCTKGMYESDTLKARIDMPLLLSMGGKGIRDTSSVFVVDNIYHEYGSAAIIMQSSTGLDNLLKLLQNNPELAIEIRSHTDSRGPAAFNQDLSMRRAKAIADYLITRGIAETRLAYKGVGEGELLNNCADGVLCTEEEHLQNRRTEFRATKLK